MGQLNRLQIYWASKTSQPPTLLYLVTTMDSLKNKIKNVNKLRVQLQLTLRNRMNDRVTAKLVDWPCNSWLKQFVCKLEIKVF